MYGVMVFCCGKLCLMENVHIGTGETMRYLLEWIDDAVLQLKTHFFEENFSCIFLYKYDQII